MTTTNQVCALRRVSKNYGGHRVLTSVNIAVQPGQIVAITGPSGAGKSTALNILGLLDKADEGEVELFGQPAPQSGSREARLLLRHRLGYMFQNAALVESMSAGANVGLAQRYQRATKRQKRDSLVEAMTAVGLDGFENRPVYSLSGGEQQRVALARLIASPRELVLADEPTGSLDPKNRDHVIALLRELRSRETAVLVVTHDPVMAAAADHVVELAP
jgi:putative ABC transport system ATP-binding protein